MPHVATANQASPASQPGFLYLPTYLPCTMGSLSRRSTDRISPIAPLNIAVEYRAEVPATAIPHYLLELIYRVNLHRVRVFRRYAKIYTKKKQM